MPKIERIELEAHLEPLQADVAALVDRYLAIAEWDVPDIDEPLATRLIIGAIRQALDQAELALPGARPA